MRASLRAGAALAFVALHTALAGAQSLSQRGFVDASALLFPATTQTDSVRAVGDLRVRDEVFVSASSWLRLAAGVEARANSHEQVDTRWRLDADDRGLRRPALSLRRATATFTRGPLTLDLGRQFIRWGKADIVTPTDRFAPRDFINVVSSEFLGVSGARAVVQRGADTIDVAWVPRLTPSRMPLLDQRWTVLPPSAAGLTLKPAPAVLPTRDQVGVRWGRVMDGYEWSASVYDGVSHMPNVASVPGTSLREVLLVRSYPRMRMYGADVAVPTRWATLKGETALVRSPDGQSDEYLLYVVQAERQTGEWNLLAGYAGEWVTTRRVAQTFAPDRGLTKSVVARASYTVDANRSAAVETAVRQNGRGVYLKGEFSQARGAHWRATVAGVAIAGRSDDFLGQYRRNSNISLALRYSF